MSESPGLAAEYARFLRRHPMWWVLPPLVILGALAALVFLSARVDIAASVYQL